MKTSLLLSVCAAAALSGCATGQSDAVTDPLSVLEVSQTETREALMLFVSYNETGASVTIFTPELVARLSKSYRFLRVEAPHSAYTLSPEARERNRLLFSEYEVDGLPFLVLQSAQGDAYFAQPIHSTLSSEQELWALIRSADASRKKVLAARDRIAQTEAAEKAIAIDAFLKTVRYPRSARYDALRKEALQADHENVSGLHGDYMFHLARRRAEKFIKQENLVAAGNAYKDLAQSPFLSASQKQEAWYLTAYTYALSEKVSTEDVVACLRKAVAAHPHAARVAQIKQTIKKLLTERGI